MKKYTGITKTTQTEMSPDPNNKNIYFVALTGCKYEEELTIQFYQITITPGHAKIEMVKIGEDINANNSRPIMAYHQKMYLTSLGFMFFRVGAENGRKGPFRISVKLFSFQT